MVSIRQNLVSPSKYNIKCPYIMEPKGITVHNTANNASAENEIAYMIRNNLEVSYHYAIDDKVILQGVLENRNAWHAGDGNGPGNLTTIGIEICYSTGDKAKFEKAQENAAEFVAYKLKQYGWGIDKVYTHQHWDGKYCPHRTLSEYGWDYFLGLVNKYLNNTPAPKKELYRVRKSWNDPASQIGAFSELQNAINCCKTGGPDYEVYDSKGKVVYSNNPTPQPKPQPTPTPTPIKVNVIYQTWDDVRNTWLPKVTNDSDYAGIFGHDVCAIYADLDVHNITYAVHVKGGNWLPEVKNRNDYAGIYNKPIDGLMMKVDGGKTVYYQVHLRRTKKWLPYVTGYNKNDSNNGFAGVLGQEIDAVRIYVK